LLPRIVHNGEATDFEDMMEEEYEFDILWDSKKGLWVTTLRNGSYLLNAKIKGFKEINEYIEIGGEREFKI